LATKIRETVMTALRTVLMALPVVAMASVGAFAQDYPAKPIKMIVTWPAGGTTDVIARLIAAPLGEALGQPIAVVNQKGGGGSLGTQAMLDAPKDGYTLLMTTSGNQVLTPLKNPDVGYTVEDFVGIGQIAQRTLVLAVREDSPWQNLDDLVEAAKAEPGKYVFGAVPVSLPHLTLDSLASATGIELVHVPQQGGAPGATALLAGDVDMLPASFGTVASNLKGGKMRGLAIFNPERDPAFPDIPTASEQGYEVYGSPFTGIAVAAGVPDDVVETLRVALAEVAQDPGFQETAVKAGSNVTYLDGDAFAEVWARDWQAYQPILQN
jgi:tripartite-type tricarboxylate transporter receptor subunit TctC